MGHTEFVDEARRMNVDVAGCTHIGLLRRENQDGYLSERFLDPEGQPIVCLAVADGMGGRQEGRRASTEAIEALRESLEDLVRNDHSGPSEEWAIGIEEAVHAKVGRIAAGDEIVGTTLTLALVKGCECVIGHVGDTRAYRLHDGRLEQVTTDHTWEAHCRAQNEENPYGKALRQAVGVGDRIETETRDLTLEDGDWILLCSDGLYKMVSDETIAKVLGSSGSAAAARDRLLKMALEAGGRDNIAIGVGRIGEPKSEPFLHRLLPFRRG